MSLVVADIIKSAGEPYTGQYGTLYGFYVTFENGDNGKYNSKSADQTKFVVGQRGFLNLRLHPTRVQRQDLLHGEASKPSVR